MGLENYRITINYYVTSREKVYANIYCRNTLNGMLIKVFKCGLSYTGSINTRKFRSYSRLEKQVNRKVEKACNKLRRIVKSRSSLPSTKVLEIPE